MDPQAKLFHVLVVVGAGMTGTLGACSAGVSPDAQKDAAADGEYAHISIDAGRHSDAYVNIGPSCDSGFATPPYGYCDYGNIDSGSGNDAYANIGIPTVADANEAG
jgi:hypothetical protein